jgi:hypothetical protein
MTIQALDTFTMWTAFLYGATLFFILELPYFKRVEERVPALFLILRQHQPIALMCFWAGGLWIAQELLINI